METISPGQIYLADQRGLIETNTFRINCTFNYANYQTEHRHAFGKLEVLNDEILAAGQTSKVQLKQNVYVVIIPITGEVILKDTFGIETQIDVGDVFVSYYTTGNYFEITNPYDEAWINFLYLELKADEGTDSSFGKTIAFDFDNTANELIKVVVEESIGADKKLPFSVHIGQFDGRRDTLLKLKNKASLLFAFVIAGAFEMQGRLLHERDGLALWELDEADLEALSNNAVILIIEMQGE